jgi:inosine/xanthosine triphosphatase
MEEFEGVRVVVGSTNPTKVRAAEQVFARLGHYAVQALAVPSHVPVQPLGVEETRRGALQRGQHARARARSQFGVGVGVGVGMEGGVDITPDGRGWLIGIAAIVEADRVLIGHGPRLLLPPEAVAAVVAGEELGPVIDRLSGLTEAKAGIGAIGWLTGGLVSREASWVVALAAAAAPLFHPGFYRAGQEPE